MHFRTTLTISFWSNSTAKTSDGCFAMDIMYAPRPYQWSWTERAWVSCGIVKITTETLKTTYLASYLSDHFKCLQYITHTIAHEIRDGIIFTLYDKHRGLDEYNTVYKDVKSMTFYRWKKGVWVVCWTSARWVATFASLFHSMMHMILLYTIEIEK